SPVVGMLLKNNSRLSLKLVYGNAEQIISEMRKGQLDMTILPDLKSEYGVQFDRYEERFIMTDEMWLVGSSRDASLPSTSSVKDIPAKPVVVQLDSYPGFRRLLAQKFESLRMNFKPVFE